MNDLTSLQQSISSTAISDTMTQLINLTLIPSLIITGVILVLYISRSIHRHKVDKAIFEIRDTLREMKTTHATPTSIETDPSPKDKL